MHLGRDAMDVYAEYTDQPARAFRGVTIEELHKVELVFRVNITVYELGEESAKLFVGLWENTPTLCSLICMKRIFHTFEI